MSIINTNYSIASMGKANITNYGTEEKNKYYNNNIELNAGDNVNINQNFLQRTRKRDNQNNSFIKSAYECCNLVRNNIMYILKKHEKYDEYKDKMLKIMEIMKKTKHYQILKQNWNQLELTTQQQKTLLTIKNFKKIDKNY